MIAKIAIVLAFVLAFPSSAALCRMDFARLAKLPIPEFLTPDEKEAISETFTQAEPGKVMRAFNLYAQARLRTAEPGVRRKMERFLSTRIRASRSSRNFDAYYSAATDTIAYHVSDAYKDSPLLFVILAHEWEHAIQHNTLFHEQGSWRPIKRFKQSNLAFTRYFVEVGAIRAEWQALSCLSPEVREKAAAQIMADKSLHPQYREALLRWMKTPAASAEDHLAAEHKGHRASKETVRALEERRRTDQIILRGWGVFGVGLVGGAVLARHAITSYCSDEALKENPDRIEWCTKEKPAIPSDRGLKRKAD